MDTYREKSRRIRQKGDSIAMNITKREDGTSLIEALIYCSLITIILNMAFIVYFESQSNHIQLQNFTTQIVRTLEIGEDWREDIRRASQQPTLTKDGALKITHAKLQTVYSFKNGILWKKKDGAEPIAVLRGIKSFRFVKDNRKFVQAWRCELELLPTGKTSKTRRVFTFESVNPQA
jgi:hypothetical protein